MKRAASRWKSLLYLALFIALVSPAPRAFAQERAGAAVLLAPVGDTTAALQTHTTDIQLEQSGTSVIGTVNSLYRLRNETPSPISVTLRATAPTAVGDTSLPADLTITVDGVNVALTPVDSGGEFEVTVPSNGREDVRLAYTYSLGDGAIQQARYPASELGNWARTTSFRLAFLIPPSIPEEAWLNIAPEGWRYGPTESSDLTSIRWLYEGNLPGEPFTFSFVNPATWQQVAQSRTAAQAGGVAEKSALGNIYAQLSTQAQDVAVRERFYAQAIAAFAEALSQGTAAGALPGDLALAYVGEARLFRERIVASGGVSAEHARLLVDAGMKALGALAADSPQRAEVEQWLSDGLSLVLSDARERRDWQAALDTLARMEASASANTAGSAFSAEAIAEERKRILFEQSLQLLEEGQRDAAVAVSGEGIVGPELQPPAEAVSLFASWQNTVTVGTNGTTVVFAGLPAPGKGDGARTAAQTLAEAWQTSAASIGGSVQVTLPPAEADDLPIIFSVRLPTGVSGLALANSTPLRPDWALLRTLLTQLAPEVSGKSTFLRRNVLLALPLDLRTAGEQWQRIAGDLEAQASALDVQSSPGDRSDAAALEAAIKARIQSANYRAEATNWRSLVNNSQTVALLEGPRGAPSDARAWQVTVNDPPQLLQFSTWGMNIGGVLAILAAALGVIMILAAILWYLL